jgi:hypothetical protein
VLIGFPLASVTIATKYKFSLNISQGGNSKNGIIRNRNIRGNPMATQFQLWTQNLEPDSLHPGSLGAEVTSLQLALKALALFEGSVDGYFGPNTGAALQKLQRQFGLAETGELDTETWYTLSFWAESAKPQVLDAAQNRSLWSRWLTALTRIFRSSNTADSHL